MKSLLWKQWQESKPHLAIFLVWMVLAVIYCVAYELGYRFRAPVGHFSVLALFYAFCGAIFLAMRASQGEQTAGTLSFSASLPVSMRQIAAVRIAGAVATLAIPIIVAAALLSLAFASGLVQQAAPRGDHIFSHLPQRDTASLLTALEQLASVTAIAIFGGIELLLMLSLIGCLFRSQAQVGLLGAVMVLGSMIASSLLWYGERKPYAQLVYGAVIPQSLMINWSYGAEHGGYTDHELAQYRWCALGFSIPVLMILGFLFVMQYGRLGNALSAAKPSRFRFRTPSLWSHVPMRLPGPWSALVWLELRQSGPLAIFGLIFALLVAIASMVIEPEANHSVLAEMPDTIAFVGMLWAVVVGSALYSAELGSGLGGFWRSRPISSGRWFWCKFIVGLAAVLIVLDVVTILTSWNAPRDSPTSGMSWAYVGCFPIVHALMYALAVLGTCWFRKPVIGAFVAILGYAVLTLTITAFPLTDSLEPIDIYNKLLQAERAGNIDFAQHRYPLVYGVIAISIPMLGLISSRLARPLEPTFRRFARLIE
jgi:ABC-type transport system involved in multi-copper enzyme maturation permease subunit